MKVNVLRTVAGILLTGVFLACSVKEDRSGCPCRLMLDLSDVDTNVVKSLNLLVWSDDGLLGSDKIEADDFENTYVMKVSREKLRLNLWNGDYEGYDDFGEIRIPYGCECPQLYMQSMVADAVGETWFAKVRLGKNHCRLTVMMEGTDAVPYSFTFKGNIAGYNAEGRPSQGEFACVAYPEDERSSYAMVPRQVDNSLMLEVDDGTRVVKTFALGEYIAATGYDWTQSDLKDITIVIDYSITYIKVSVSGWAGEYLYNIVL